MLKISIIIPCFNQGHFINEALDSVFKQTYTNWEIIIVNDGSDDGLTEQILLDINGPKVKIIHIENSGLATARNIGISHSVGEYILPLDADDKIHPLYLAKALSIFEQNQAISIVYSKAEYFGNKTGVFELPDFDINVMLKQNLIFCSAIYSREMFNKVGGYNPNMKYGWEDWDLWLSFIELDACIYKIDETMFYYRKHESSMVEEISKNISKRQYLEQQLVKNHIDLYFKYYTEPLSMLRELDSFLSYKNSFEKWEKEILKSYEFRLGKLLLIPFRNLYRLFNKK